MSLTPRLRTGITQLDKMLAGGFLRGDSVLLAGSAGTGKSTLCLQYLVQGAKEGESGIYLTFEELPDQIYRDALSIGMDLEGLERGKKLKVICTSPQVLLEPDGIQAILNGPVKEINARRIAVDSISHFGMFVKPEDMRLKVYQTIRFFKTKGLSSLLCWESPQMLGQSFAVSEEGISFLTDAIVLLKYIEIESGIRRGIVVLKMRGSGHDMHLREYETTSTGLKVTAPFTEYEGLLGGSPTKRASEKFADLFTKAVTEKK